MVIGLDDSCDGLVIKEIGNSGHLDALATCLMTLAISLLLSVLATMLSVTNIAVLEVAGLPPLLLRPQESPHLIVLASE